MEGHDLWQLQLLQHQHHQQQQQLQPLDHLLYHQPSTAMFPTSTSSEMPLQALNFQNPQILNFQLQQQQQQQQQPPAQLQQQQQQQQFPQQPAPKRRKQRTTDTPICQLAVGKNDLGAAPVSPPANYTSGTMSSSGLSGWRDLGAAPSDELPKRPRADMTEEERLQHERERNRVHARNTRARKKQHVEQLKARVNELARVKEKQVEEVTDAERLVSDKQDGWKMILRKVLEARAAGVTDEGVWKNLLTEDFRLTLPLTPYRPSTPPAAMKDRQEVYGVAGMIHDVQSLTKLREAIAACGCRNGGVDDVNGGADGCDGGGSGGGALSDSAEEGNSGDDEVDGTAGVGGGSAQRKGKKNRPAVAVEYLIGADDYMFAGENGFMSSFVFCSTDAVKYGIPSEVEKCGMLRGKFNKRDGKMEQLDLMFDGFAFCHQLKQINVPLVSTVPLLNLPERVI